jgi:hypothetical protein
VKYGFGKEVEFARFGVNKVILNTKSKNLAIQFGKDSGNTFLFLYRNF